MHENGLYLEILVTPEGDVRLLCLGPETAPLPEDTRWMRLLECQAAGYNQDDNCGSKHTGTQPGSLFRYESHTITRNGLGAKLEVRQSWRGLKAISTLQFYDGAKAVRSVTELVNDGTDETFAVEYLSSFKLAGLLGGTRAQLRADHAVHIPQSTWCAEAQWQARTLADYGYAPVFGGGNRFSMRRVALSSTGTWPAGEHLPMGALSDAASGGTLAWQLETAGSWTWEISESEGLLYLALSGPSLQENGFTLPLEPGGRFTSVPARWRGGRILRNRCSN
jgi:alpha-galactosidase